MDTFVNPIPGMKVEGFLNFDFPLPRYAAEYRTPDCKLNVDLNQPWPRPSSEVPTQEGVYGRLGRPKRNQGFPCIYEKYPEDEDPGKLDMIIDIDRKACIDHTGRLSGSFVKFLEGNPDYKSIVKMHIVPLTQGDGTPELIYSVTAPLVAGPKAPDKWYWDKANNYNELIYTAHKRIESQYWDAQKLEPGVFKLVISWEFWNYKNSANPVRFPMSGFDESMSFQLSAATRI